MDLEQELKVAMTRRGVSQRDLAQLVGKHETTVSRHLHNLDKAPFGALRDYATALEVPLGELIERAETSSKERVA